MSLLTLTFHGMKVYRGVSGGSDSDPQETPQAAGMGSLEASVKPADPFYAAERRKVAQVVRSRWMNAFNSALTGLCVQAEQMTDPKRITEDAADIADAAVVSIEKRLPFEPEEK